MRRRQLGRPPSFIVRIGPAVRETGFSPTCMSASHTVTNKELKSGPLDLRSWKNIAGGFFFVSYARTACVWILRFETDRNCEYADYSNLISYISV